MRFTLPFSSPTLTSILSWHGRTSSITCCFRVSSDDCTSSWLFLPFFLRFHETCVSRFSGNPQDTCVSRFSLKPTFHVTLLHMWPLVPLAVFICVVEALGFSDDEHAMVPLGWRFFTDTWNLPMMTSWQTPVKFGMVAVGTAPAVAHRRTPSVTSRVRWHASLATPSAVRLGWKSQTATSVLNCYGTCRPRFRCTRSWSPP